ISHMSPDLFYALGFYGSDKDGMLAYGHSGGMPGVSTVMRLYPDEDLAVVVLTNTGDSDAVPEIEREIAGALVPRYAKALAAEAKPPEAPKNLYHPTPEFLGTWTGTLRTWQGT